MSEYLRRGFRRSSSSLEYIPEIDGLRAVAMFLVLGHHVLAAYLESTHRLGPQSLPRDSGPNRATGSIYSVGNQHELWSAALLRHQWLCARDSLRTHSASKLPGAIGQTLPDAPTDSPRTSLCHQLARWVCNRHFATPFWVNLARLGGAPLLSPPAGVVGLSAWGDLRPGKLDQWSGWTLEIEVQFYLSCPSWRASSVFTGPRCAE